MSGPGSATGATSQSMDPTCDPHSKREQTTKNESTTIESSPLIGPQLKSLGHARIEGRGGAGGLDPPPMKNHKNIGFPRKTGPDPLKNYKATKPAFNVGPSFARSLNGVSLVGR